MYWHAVLYEVICKNAFSHGLTYTDIRDNHSSHFRTCSRNSGSFIASRRRKTIMRQYPIGDAYPNTYFTQREAECMQQFLKGSTIEQAAAAIGISARTVEYYLLNMKNKFHCRSKAELIRKIASTRFAKEAKVERL